jgi:uncharacterized protein (UPF0262 family)
MEAAAQPTPLSDVLIDEMTWRCAPRPRRAEWQQAIADLIEEGTFFFDKSAEPQVMPPAALHGRVELQPDGVRLLLYAANGTEVGRMELKHSVLAPLLREYVQKLSAFDGGLDSVGGDAEQFEAMDIARRLIHDDAAELLQRSCVGARPDHKTARRLFTLLVLLMHDPEKLSPASPWPS